MICMNTRTSTLTSLALISALALSACADDGVSADTGDAETGTAETGTAEENQDQDQASDAGESDDLDPADRSVQEVGGAVPRLAITYEGGVAIVDGTTLDVVDQFEADGFLRVNPAGDGRHVFLSESESFRLIDAGTWGEPHGDHDHYYTTEPYLSDVTVDGETPGHVVAHDGIGTLFFDGTGEIRSFELDDLDVEADLSTDGAETEEAHHGVAIVFEDGSRFETLGDADSRTGARVVDAEGEEIARSEECPGVHGEAAGPDHMIAVGCEDGVLIWHGDHFDKIEAGPEFARIGNLFPHPDSPVLLGDYRTDQEEPMTEIALIDTDSMEITTSEISAAYNFRSLARGPEGEALVLAEDGQLHVIDPQTGEHLDHIQVIEEWTEPQEWQQPRPAISVEGSIAYVTDPENQQIHMVDLAEVEVIHTGDLDFVPNEVAVATGRPAPEETDQEHDDEEDDHGHDDDDDDHDDHDH